VDPHFEGHGSPQDEPTVPLAPRQYQHQHQYPAEPAHYLAYSQISGEPRPAPMPGKYNVGRLLRRCAGVKEELLAWAPAERARYTGLGGFVLLTSLMAVGSSTIALMIAFDKPWYYVILPALFWGLLIFNLDRWIVSSPLPEYGLRRVATILPRLMMAIVFGIVIAEPVVLKVFETAVTEKLGEIRAAEDAAYRSLVEQCNPAVADAAAGPGRSAAECKDVIIPQSSAVATARGTQANAQRAVDESATRLATVGKELDEARVQMNNECRGLDGSPHGEGPVCRHLTTVYNGILNRYNEVDAGDRQLRVALTTAGGAVAAAEAAQDQFRSQEITRMIEKRQQDRDNEGGLLERIEALNSVAADHFSLLLAIWAVRLLLILIDSAPAIGKFTSGTTTYDRLAREESRLGEQKHRARSTVEEELAQNWIDESEEHEEIVRAGRRHQRDRAADALLLSAARHRQQQAPHFQPVVADDQRPFGRASYTMVARVEPAGMAKQPPLHLDLGPAAGNGADRDAG